MNLVVSLNNIDELKDINIDENIKEKFDNIFYVFNDSQIEKLKLLYPNDIIIVNKNNKLFNNKVNISILIPVYNCEKYIKTCLDSCLKQDFEGTYEIIIVDDGSTDNTVNIIKSYNDNKIKLYKLEHNGISNALNFGLSKCEGEYICRMDGDDEMYVNRLTIQYKYMLRHPDTDILSNGLLCFDESLTYIKDNISICNFDKSNLLLLDIVNNCDIHHPCTFIKNNINGFYYDNTYDGFEDYELWFRLIKYGYKISSWHIPVIKYRYRENSNSHNINIVNDVNKLKTNILEESKKIVGIYYIATGIYKNNFKKFLESIHNFLPIYNKTIILLTDGLEEYKNYSKDNINIEHHYIEDHPWPIVALFRFHYILKYKTNYDYIFFINSNAVIKENKSINWFDQNKINVTKHFTYRSGVLTTYEMLLPSDDNPNSTSYIGNIEYTYCQSGFFGGPNNLIYEMCEDIVNIIDIDLKNNIIAKWHDETYFNKWLYSKKYDNRLINITDVFFTKNFSQEKKSNFIYLEYKNEDDKDLNKKKKLENKLNYGQYKNEHNYDLDKNTLNKI